MDDIHFEPFVIESGGQFGGKAQQVFKKICNLVTQSTGQCGSNIAYFWKSKLLVAITFSNAQKWFKAYKKSQDLDSLILDLTDI